MYGIKFLDNFKSPVRERYKCGINQVEKEKSGDMWLIIDKGCEKFRSNEEEL